MSRALRLGACASLFRLFSDTTGYLCILSDLSKINEHDSTWYDDACTLDCCVDGPVDGEVVIGDSDLIAI